jgi:hypothetical protein
MRLSALLFRCQAWQARVGQLWDDAINWLFGTRRSNDRLFGHPRLSQQHQRGGSWSYDGSYLATRLLLSLTVLEMRDVLVTLS